MKALCTALTTALALSAFAWMVNAQRTNSPPPQGQRHPPPLSPLFAALDVNHDGVIDSNEIANAPAALKTLDKNGDGQLTMDEICPQRPGGQGAGCQPPPK